MITNDGIKRQLEGPEAAIHAAFSTSRKRTPTQVARCGLFGRVQPVEIRVGRSGSGLESIMGGSARTWDRELVRIWLEKRCEAAKVEQAAADRQGHEAQDDYDKAAAEEWVCQVLRTAAYTDDQAAFASQLKELLARDEYPSTGIYDDRRFDRCVRATLRKLVKMTKANDGFANTLRYQG